VEPSSERVKKKKKKRKKERKEKEKENKTKQKKRKESKAKKWNCKEDVGKAAARMNGKRGIILRGCEIRIR
jgi:phosphopantetheinyl transferase (holo-ACP synthase)